MQHPFSSFFAFVPVDGICVVVVVVVVVVGTCTIMTNNRSFLFVDGRYT